MAVFHENMLIGSSGQGGQAQYEISRSVRLNSADSAHFSRTIATAGNRKTWTWSGWVKRSGLGVLSIIFSSGVDSSNNFRFSFNASNQLQVENEATAVVTTFRVTTAIYRDPTAWMHLVLAVDTTQATASNRVKLYVNGSEVTAFSSTADPALNADLNCNAAGTFKIGNNFVTNYINAYIADVRFVSGLALLPTSFGQTDSVTGEWVPIAYTGSYGTNGHWLTFSDNSAATAAALGADSSGAGNNFAPTNLSVTAGAGNDSMVDSPVSYGTDTGLGGEVRGNYCILNPQSNPGDQTLSNGGLDTITVSGGKNSVFGTISMRSGKWYWECTPTDLQSDSSIGISQSEFTANSAIGDTATSYGYLSSGLKSNNGNAAAYGAAYIVNDVVGVALDLDAGTLTFYRNGVSQGTAFTGLSGAYVPGISDIQGATTASVTANFGQRPFAYAAPSGFKALCDTNFTDPPIAKPSTVRGNVLYTGTGASLTPTSSLAFAPGLVWVKGRSGATDHAVYDIVRGATADLVTNSNGVETTQAQGLTAFNSNGFTVGTLAKLNTNLATYVAWCWDAGSSTVTNTTGTIQSSVRANVSTGISVLTYTGTGTAGNVGHGLGAAPQFVIVKRRTGGTGDSWAMWHSAIGGTTYMALDSTASAPTTSSAVFSGAPSSTLVNIGTSTLVNASTSNYVCYCFAPVTGYSAFGSYTGNSNANGPFVNLGFRPAWILIKAFSGVTTSWMIIDSARPGFEANYTLANDAGAEATNQNYISITSTGFKAVNTANAINSNNSFLYAAFAESPFKYSRAR